MTLTVQVKRKRKASKKPRKSETSLVARVGKKEGKGTAATQLAYAEMQEQAQLGQTQPENKMQENAMAFQAKMGQERVTFELVLSTRLQQPNSQFQMSMISKSSSFWQNCSKHYLTKRTVNEAWHMLPLFPICMQY